MEETSPIEYINATSQDIEEDLRWDSIDQARLSDIPRVLYHYADTSGVAGILRQKAIYATDLRFMNDAGELQYTRALIDEALETRLPGCKEYVAAAFKVVPTVLGDLPFRFYATCFCDAEDLLSQWRAYGNAGGGYAVGLNSEYLARIGAKKGTALILRKIEYDPNLQRARVGRILDSFIGLANRCQSDFREHADFLHALQACASRTAVLLVSELSQMKHPLFAEEREWRLVALEPATSLFRISRTGVLVPYLQRPLTSPEDSISALSELRWGYRIRRKERILNAR